MFPLTALIQFLREGLFLNMEFMTLLGWLVSELRDLPVSALPVLELEVYATAPSHLHSWYRANAVLRFVAGTFPTKPALGP